MQFNWHLTMEHFYKNQKRTYSYPRVRLHWANFLRNLRVFEDSTLLQRAGVQQALAKCNLTSKDLMRFVEWSMDQLGEPQLTPSDLSTKTAGETIPAVSSQFFEIPSETFNCTFLGRKRQYQPNSIKWQTWADCYADKPTILQILSPMRCEHKAFFNLAYRYQFEFGAHIECMRLVSSQLDHFTLCYNSQDECLQPFLCDDVLHMIRSKPMSDTELRQLTEQGELYAVKGNGTPPPIYLHNVSIDVRGQTFPFLNTQSMQSKKIHNTIQSRMEIFDRYIEETDYEPGFYRFKTFIEAPLTQITDPEIFHQKLDINRFYNAYYEFSQVINYRDILFRITARTRYSRLNKSTTESFHSGVHPWSLHIDYANSSQPIEPETFWLVATTIYRYYRCIHDQLISKQRHIPFLIHTPVQVTERMRKKLKPEELEVLQNIILVYHDGEVVCNNEDPFVKMMEYQEPKGFKPLIDFVECMGYVVMPELAGQNNKIFNNTSVTETTTTTIPTAEQTTAPSNAVKKKEPNSQSNSVQTKSIKFKKPKGLKPRNNDSDDDNKTESSNNTLVIPTDNGTNDNDTDNHYDDNDSYSHNSGDNDAVNGTAELSVDDTKNYNNHKIKNDNNYADKGEENNDINCDTDYDADFKDIERVSDCDDTVNVLQTNSIYLESALNAVANTTSNDPNDIDTDISNDIKGFKLETKIENGNQPNNQLWDNVKECLIKFVDE